MGDVPEWITFDRIVFYWGRVAEILFDDLLPSGKFKIEMCDSNIGAVPSAATN